MTQHQISNVTKYNRYPNIFQVCSEYFSKKPLSQPLSILSFGCSDGTEVFTLRDLYFKDAYIQGVDISEEMIKVCNSKNTDTNIRFTLSNEISSNDWYDVIFCMSVLCRWPKTQHILDCSNEYPFVEFDKQVVQLYNHLNKGGLLVIYNSNFCFYESKIYPNFSPLTDPRIKESGFVHKFNSKNQKIDTNYPDCIFIKKHKARLKIK